MNAYYSNLLNKNTQQTEIELQQRLPPKLAATAATTRQWHCGSGVNDASTLAKLRPAR